MVGASGAVGPLCTAGSDGTAPRRPPRPGPARRLAGVQPTEISAGTLHLRAPQHRDVPELTSACQDAEIARWTRVPTPYTEADARAFVERAAENWRLDRAASFVVLDSTTAALLANVRLGLDADGDAELGYWVAPWARSRGVGRRSVATLCRWGFGALDLQRITWKAAVGNEASRRLAERVGFVHEGTLRAGVLLHGERRDCWIGSLLPGDRISA